MRQYTQQQTQTELDTSSLILDGDSNREFVWMSVFSSLSKYCKYLILFA